MRHFIFIITLLLSITGHAKQTQSVSTEIKNGIPTELWLSAISNRNTKNELKKISSLKKPLSSNELKWKNALQDALPIFESNKQKVNSLFPKVSPPKSIKILLGNQGGNDAFTYKKEYICLDLSEWVQYYGTPKNTDLDRVSRILLHEYAHLVTKAWLEKYPQQADSLYSKALFEMFYEGIGNYFSLSRKQLSLLNFASNDNRAEDITKEGLLELRDELVVQSRKTLFLNTAQIISKYLTGSNWTPEQLVQYTAYRVLPHGTTLGVTTDDKTEDRKKLATLILDDPKAFGKLALPPYIEKKRLNQNESLLNDKDLNAYQTIYSKKGSSCAAPTAGLHFTPRVFDALNEMEILWREITLNVGVGTFRPVKTEDIRKHSMHEESFEIDSDLANELTEFKSKVPICAVGTTTLRALESAWNGEELRSGDQKTDVFFYPGSESRIKFVDQLITNFHLPGSTLLMLICHFAKDKEFILEAYREAIQKKYRFFSYGDAMLIR